MLSVSERTPIKVLILSDSIPKHVTDIRHTEVLALPDIHINHLASKIEKGQIVLDKPCIVHVGTNDINSMDAGAMLRSFNNLLAN